MTDKMWLTEAGEKAFEAAKQVIEIECRERIRREREMGQEQERREAMERKIGEHAAETRMLFDRYREVGFTEEQAWELIKIYAQLHPLYVFSAGCA